MAGRGARSFFVSALIGAVFVSSSCSKETAKNLPPPPSLKESGASVVARVGEVEITEETVRAIMAAQHVDARAAVELAVRDAVFARAAVDGRLDVGVARRIDGVLARDLAMQAGEKAAQAGPITDEELKPLVEARYFEVARPEAWVTAHALVPLSEDAPEDDVARAKAVAEKIREVVLPVAEGLRGSHAPWANDPGFESFYNAANSVDAGGFTLVVQPVPPLAADGRTVVASSADRSPFDPPFVAAATSLRARGDVSPVFRGHFGWHVVVLLDRVGARMLPREQLVELFRDEVLSARAKAILAKDLDPLRAPILDKIDRNIDSTLALVKIQGVGALESAAGTPVDPGAELPR